MEEEECTISETAWLQVREREKQNTRNKRRERTSLFYRAQKSGQLLCSGHIATGQGDNLVKLASNHPVTCRVWGLFFKRDLLESILGDRNIHGNHLVVNRLLTSQVIWARVKTFVITELLHGCAAL